MKERVVSSDSHVMEPADLWTARLDNRLKDQSPKVVKNEGRPGYSFVAPGVFPFPVAAVGRDRQERRRTQGASHQGL